MEVRGCVCARIVWYVVCVCICVLAEAACWKSKDSLCQRYSTELTTWFAVSLGGGNGAANLSVGKKSFTLGRRRGTQGVMMEKIRESRHGDSPEQLTRTS